MAFTYGEGAYGAGLYSAENTLEVERITAWSFALDGHIYYVLNIGSGGSLIYDATTSSWSEWRTFGRSGLPSKIGYQVDDLCLIGDSESGVIYYFKSEEHADFFGAIETAVSAEYLIDDGFRSLFSLKMYGAFSGIEGDVSLWASDDYGKNFDLLGTETITQNPTEIVTVDWSSIGAAGAPGRIFEIFDSGGFSKITGLRLEVSDA